MSLRGFRKFFVLAVALAGFSFASQTAMADTFNLSNCVSTNSQICGPSSWGTVSLTQNGSKQVDFSISMASGFKLFGFGWNFLGTAVGLDVLSANPSPPWANKTNFTNSGNRDGFGSFDYFLSDPNGSNATSTLTFSVKRNDGSDLSVSDLKELSNGGGSGKAYFVAEVTASPCSTTSQLPCTGWSGVGEQTTPVPEPASLLLIGSGISAIVVRRRRK